MERIDLRSPGGTVLLGSPATIPLGFRARLDQHAAIRAIFGDPHAVERLRWLWPRLELGGTARNVTDHDLRMAADHAVSHGRLVAVLAPKHLPEFHPADGAAKAAAPRLAAGGQAPAKPAVPEEAGDRIIEALKRSRRHVGPELVKMIDQMLVPSLVIGLVTLLLGLIALQFTGPIAAAIDGALIVIAWACAGVAGITAAYQFVEATRLAVAARSPADLDAAGKLYADAFIVLGTVFLAWLLRRIQVKRAGGSKPVERTSAPAADEPLPKQPVPPKTIKSPLQAAIDAALKKTSPEFQKAYAEAEAAGWKKPNGDPWWPPEPGTIGDPVEATLLKGTELDRYGPETGKYLSKAGDSFISRATNRSPDELLNEYVVEKPIDVMTGEIAPWFGQPGGGTQYQLLSPIDGKPMSVETAKALGLLSGGK